MKPKKENGKKEVYCGKVRIQSSAIVVNVRKRLKINRARRTDWENNNWKERRGGEVKWECDRQIHLSWGMERDSDGEKERENAWIGMHGHSSLHEAQRLTGDQHKVWLIKNPADASHTNTHAKTHKFLHTFPQASPRAMCNILFASKSGNKHTHPQSRYSSVVSPWNMWRKRTLIHTHTVTVSLVHQKIMGLRGQRGLRKTKDRQCSMKTPNKDTYYELLHGHLSWNVGVCVAIYLDCTSWAKFSTQPEVPG